MISKKDRELANSLMSIYKAYSLVTGVDVQPSEYVSAKTMCPYTGIFHSSARTLRFYPSTNSAYCFSCGEYLTPIKLISNFNDFSEEDSIDFIKRETGYKEPDPELIWDAMMEESETEIDKNYLIEALKVYCSSLDDYWSISQFESEVSAQFGKCLGLLGLVKDSDDIDKWFSLSKEAMRRVLTTRADA